MEGSLARARAALASRDFRFVLSARLVSQFADGVFQAYLVDRIVFLSTDTKGTAVGVAVALALLVIPYSAVGPFVGVFVDRWSRRRILLVTPLVRAAVALPLLAQHGGATWPTYVLALVVVSLDRFYLTTAGAVMPAVVPADDLLVGNAMAGALGTVTTFLGLFAGSQVAAATGASVLAGVTAGLLGASGALAAGIGRPLRTNLPPVRLLAEVRRIAVDFAAGARRLVATPPAFGGIVTVTIDQILFGIVTVLSIVVFRHRFHGGVASYGRIIGVGGVGLVLGTFAVGALESRGLSKPRIVALAFALGGLACAAAAPALAPPSVLAVSFLLGLAYPWKKIPVDTVTQQAVPDRFRGRVFAVYDLGASMARVVGAVIAAALLPHLSVPAILEGIGLCYLAWTAVVPAWLARPVRARVRFYAGGRAEETPRAIVVGGEEEPVAVVRSWTEQAAGVMRRRFRVRGLESELDLVEDPAGGRWLVREAQRGTPIRPGGQ